MGQCDGGRIDPQQLTPKTEDTTVWGAVGARAVYVAGRGARACGVPSTVSVLCAIHTRRLVPLVNVELQNPK